MRSLLVIAALLLTSQAIKLTSKYDDLFDNEEHDNREIMNSLASAEKAIGQKMDTPKKVRDPEQPFAPVKYDIESAMVQISE